MTTGISTASLFGRYNTEDTFSILRDMGVKVAEVCLSTFSEYEPAFAQRLTALKGDLQIHSVHALTTQFEPQLFNVSARVRADAEAIFRKVLSCGKTLGAKYYTFHGPMQLKAIRYNLDYDKIAATVNRLIAIAAEYDIRLSYENVHWCYFSYPQFFTELKTRCPELGATLDIKQARQSGADVYEYLDVTADRLTTVHICDCVGVETALPGKGEFDFKRFIDTLKKRNVTAPLFVEAYAKDFATLSELKDAYDYITRLTN